EGCGQPMRKRSWCAAHYSQWRQTGKVEPFKHKWATRGSCWVCGEPCTRSGFRRSCSPACQGVLDRSGNSPIDEVTCAICNQSVPLARPGRRVRSDTRLCAECRRIKHGGDIARLRERDGDDCQLCGAVIDFSLRKEDTFMCVSVDHITPRSLGGSNDEANLQLAHLLCNISKGNR